MRGGSIYSNKEATRRSCAHREDSISAFRGPLWWSHGRDSGFRVMAAGLSLTSPRIGHVQQVPSKAAPPCWCPLSQLHPKHLSAVALNPPGSLFQIDRSTPPVGEACKMGQASVPFLCPCLLFLPPPPASTTTLCVPSIALLTLDSSRPSGQVQGTSASQPLTQGLALSRHSLKLTGWVKKCTSLPFCPGGTPYPPLFSESGPHPGPSS